MLNYRKLFDPEALRPNAPTLEKPRRPFVADYEYDEAIVLAVNVALATGRPLLLRGDAGSGKSTLAEDVARLLRYRYYEQVVSSNVEVADLLFRIDHLSRIADAHAGNADARDKPERYLRPGVLFWAFTPALAREYGKHDPELRTWELDTPDTRPAVVLLDEIDKAEPDFPNDLLVPLGSLSFQIRASNLDVAVAATPEMRPLVVVTTNEERDLPDAFLRRCVVLRLEAPRGERLSAIARRHFTKEQLDASMLETLMTRYFELRKAAEKPKLRPPGTAEFLDAARALVELREAEGGSSQDFVARNTWAFHELTQAAMWKHRQPPETSR
ncbi:hypothetical protein sce2278 [Sorangium cellulosum So ce56]|uniref:AAA+ ATPase domain-containing protein n=1 Tax=Sorangium cellulosum (strain So ce56) TaxID=448385 RepID=A9G0U5_SORC5|nr:MoxR family ATPase [Sorangium cellulosum]CAN92437.1 hypothetical protein sce2278 [Sorangium cellulosum So ce56]